MKYPTTAYAKALATVLEQQPQDVRATAQRFLKLLDKTGDRPALRRIVDQAERMLLARRGGKKIIIESARAIPKDAANHFAKSFGAHDALEYRINPELIAGVRVRIGEDAIVDSTLAGRLNRLTAKLRNL